MNPSIWMYGGVHHDQRFAAWRPWIAEGLSSCWNFLTREDCEQFPESDKTQ
jgi:hypothetical protein